MIDVGNSVLVSRTIKPVQVAHVLEAKLDKYHPAFFATDGDIYFWDSHYDEYDRLCLTPNDIVKIYEVVKCL